MQPILVAMVPALAYASLLGVRLLPFLLIILLALVAFTKQKFSKDVIFISLPLFGIFGCSLIYAIHTQSTNSSIAIICFLMIFILTQIIISGNTNLIRFINWYVIFAFFNAVLIIIQILSLIVFKVEFFKIEYYSGRIAFAGIWSDFSVVSIYLASAIPIALYQFKEKKLSFSLITVTLILGCILTTARSGIAALLLVVLIYFLSKFIIAFLSARLSKSLFFTFVIISIVGIFMILSINIFADHISVFFQRGGLLEDNSRIKSYLLALDFINQNIYIGTGFDDEYYKKLHSYLPHNSLLYVLVSGGIFVLLLFIFWLSMLYFISFGGKYNLLYLAFDVAMIGTLFVPSVFSMYFLASLAALRLGAHSSVSICYDARN